MTGSDSTVAQMKSAIQQVLGNRKDFETIWRQTIHEFETWMRGLPAAPSSLTRNLELLRRLCANFGDESIRDDEGVQNAVLSGALEVGKTLEFGGSRYEVIARTLSPRGGVVYRLRGEGGDIIEHEFFD